MDAKEIKRAEFESTVELLMDQWKDLDHHLKDLSLEPKKEVDYLGASAEENRFICFRLRELKRKESEILLKMRESELKEREREEVLEKKQKFLDKRILKQKVQERVFEKRENNNRAEREGVVKRESDLSLGMKKVADDQKALDVKIMMFDIKTESFSVESSGSKNSQEQDLQSAVKMEGIDRKRSRNGDSDRGKEMVESSTQLQASGAAKNVQFHDGLSFMVKIIPAHGTNVHMTIPAYYLAVCDLSEKKNVILSTDEGDFRLEVKHYYDPRHPTCQHATFGRGWKEFYCKNRLSSGMLCVFKMKEYTVNGDASVFSMEVAVLGR